MKIRTGFVSNSSSSSYTCCVCGNEQSGWDLSLSDIDMCECVNGHVFCTDHKLSQKAEEEEKEEEDDNYDDDYEIPEEFCPICQMGSFTDDDLLFYFFKKEQLTRQEVETEIRLKFGNYKKFKKFIK